MKFEIVVVAVAVVVFPFHPEMLVFEFAFSRIHNLSKEPLNLTS